MHQVAIAPIEAYIDTTEQGTSWAIDATTWLVPIIATVLVILVLNRKTILGMVRSG